MLNSRENAVGSQTPRAYLLELASAARRTLPTSLSYSECGTRPVSFGPHRDALVRARHGDLTGEQGGSAGPQGPQVIGGATARRTPATSRRRQSPIGLG